MPLTLDGTAVVKCKQCTNLIITPFICCLLFHLFLTFRCQWTDCNEEKKRANKIISSNAGRIIMNCATIRCSNSIARNESWQVRAWERRGGAREKLHVEFGLYSMLLSAYASIPFSRYQHSSFRCSPFQLHHAFKLVRVMSLLWVTAF